MTFSTFPLVPGVPPTPAPGGGVALLQALCSCLSAAMAQVPPPADYYMSHDASHGTGVGMAAVGVPLGANVGEALLLFCLWVCLWWGYNLRLVDGEAAALQKSAPGSADDGGNTTVNGLVYIPTGANYSF